MILLLLGWRNLWRNPRRSCINVAAVATAFLFLILMLGLAEGVKRQLLENGTRLMLGHVELHQDHYLPDRSLYDTLGGEAGLERQALERLLASEPGVEASSERVYGFALLSTGEHSAGARLLGVVPEKERQVTTFLDSRVRGRGKLTAGGQELWLGELLARELGAQEGTEVAAVTQAADGSLGNALFRVGGILRTGLTPLDRSLAVAHLADLQELLALGSSRIHEVVLRLRDPMQASRVASHLQSRLPAHIRASSWEDLSPQLRDYVSMSESSVMVMVLFVALFASLGILNTLMMAVFERTREIGVITSLGMSRARVVGSLLIETFFLALGGLAFGWLGGAAAMSYFTSHGLDLSRWTGELTMADAYLDPVLRFAWRWDYVARAALGLLLTALAAALIPARRAARLRPVEALQAPTER